MKIRFYVDLETGAPHVLNHGVDEDEVADVCRPQARIVLDAMDLERQSGVPGAVGT